MRGRHIWNRFKDAEAMRTAIGFFERAIELDPLYARAYAGLGDSYAILGNVKAVAPEVAYPKARNALLQGLAIDDQLAELHTSLAFVQRYWEWDWEASRASLDKSLALNPGYSTTWRFYAHLLNGLGEHEEATERVLRALELDPLSLILHTSVGDTYFYARRYEQAMAYYRKCIEMDAGFIPAHTDLARALELAGRYEEALAEYKLAAHLASPDLPVPSAGLACVYGWMGRQDDARKIIQQLIDQSATRYVSPYGIGSIYACMGEADLALDWLEKAFEEHDQTLVWVKVHPRLDVLRGTERYARILERMGLG
jgi:tetratricopeptide (TPR) repeat protein